MVSEVEKAYVAGLVDGEAGISICRNAGGKKGRWLQPVIDISSNNQEVLEYVQLLYGGAINAINDRGRHLRFWTPEKVIRILGDIFPYLIIKKEHAKVMLKFCESRLQRKHHSYTANEMAWYDALKIFNS